MGQILLFSDLHCHMHKASMGRLDDCLKALDWVFRVAADRNITSIVFGGDLFQDRQKIHVISYEKTFRLIREKCAERPEIKFFLLVGNHDMWFGEKWDVSSVAPLEAIENVRVINQPCAVEVASGVFFDFLPYTKNPVEDLAKYFPERNRVLVSHIAVNGAQLNSYGTKAEVSVEFDGDMVKVDVGVFSGWDRVFLGHYHSAQKLNDSVEYIGSPLELNFGEAFSEKHLIVLDADTLATEYVVNDFSPRHLIIKENQLADYALGGNFVQVIVDDITSTDIIDLRKTVLKDSGIATLEFKERKKDEAGAAPAKIDLSGADILEKWVKAKGHGELDFDKLVSVGQDIIKKV